MQRPTPFASQRLGRVLQRAVSYALLGAVAGCGSRALEEPESTRTRAAEASEAERDDESAANPESTTGNEDPTNDDAAPSPEPSDPDDPASPPTSPGPEGEVMLTTLECVPDGGSVFASMQLTQTFDYLVQRETSMTSASDFRYERDAFGVPCQGASDAAACEGELAATWPTTSDWTSCGQVGCYAYSLVGTRGDEVIAITTHADLLTLLGPIDDEREAALWARANGYSPACGESRVGATADGYRLTTREMVFDCPIQYADVELDVGEGGALAERSRSLGEPTGACVGRRSDGVVASGERSGAGVGAFFARVSELEATAVVAFEVIAAELSLLGAPAELVDAAKSAAGDEVRHARVTAALARRYGAEPRALEAEPRSARSRLAFALDNVIEGCVRETYGAACARYQADRAEDPEVRARLLEIAADEARHAELSWRIQEWIEAELDPDERSLLEAAQKRAIAELRAELDQEPGPELCRDAGLPSAAHAHALLDVLESELWNAAA